jgi:hypothetical protein
MRARKLELDWKMFAGCSNFDLSIDQSGGEDLRFWRKEIAKLLHSSHFPNWSFSQLVIFPIGHFPNFWTRDFISKWEKHLACCSAAAVRSTFPLQVAHYLLGFCRADGQVVNLPQALITKQAGQPRRMKTSTTRVKLLQHAWNSFLQCSCRQNSREIGL